MALVGIAFSIGFIIGPMIGALFSIFTDKTSSMWFWYPATFAFLLSLADVLFVYRFFNESLPQVCVCVWKIQSFISFFIFKLCILNDIFSTGETCKTSDWIGSTSTRSYQCSCHIQVRLFLLPLFLQFNYNLLMVYFFPRLISHYNYSFVAVKNLTKNELYCLKRIGLIYFIYLFIYSGLEFTVTFLMYHKLGYTSLDQAKMFVTTGVVMAILQGSVVRRLPPQHVKRSAVFGLYLIVPAFILVGLAKDSKLLYAGMILFAICKYFHPTCISIENSTTTRVSCVVIVNTFNLFSFSNGIRSDVHDNTHFRVWKTRSERNRAWHIPFHWRSG